jgi:hypothetical protein
MRAGGGPAVHGGKDGGQRLVLAVRAGRTARAGGAGVGGIRPGTRGRRGRFGLRIPWRASAGILRRGPRGRRGGVGRTRLEHSHKVGEAHLVPGTQDTRAVDPLLVDEGPAG